MKNYIDLEGVDKGKLISISKDNKEKFGIENLKKIQIWKAELIKEIYGLIQKKKSGKRISRLAILLFLDDAWELSKILIRIKDAKDEFLDLSENELEELEALFNDRIQEIPDRDEKIIKKINSMLLVLSDGMIDIFEEEL